MNEIDEGTSTNYISLKKLEHVLNNKTESFPNKVESLIQVWKQVSDCRLTEQKQYIVHLMDWLKLHTLNIVLTGDWKKVKDTFEERLLKEVKHCEMLLLHSNNIFSLRCRKLAEVIKDPWGNPVLNKLLNNADVVVGSEEIEFFSMETGYLISTRLRKLCESHCEDLALNLVTAFMRCHQMSEAQQFSLNATEDQKRFILDVYIALLYKYKRTSLIVSTLKSLSLREGLDLLQRFVHKRVNISKIWRHSNRIAHLAAQVYITATIMKTADENLSILAELLNTWFSLHEINENLDTLTATIRRIIQAADSAVHVYIFCEAVNKKFGLSMKTFTIELYIRALTTDMNDLERQKTEDDDMKVPETTKRLALGFLHLADLLEEHVKVSRECVLTSFSLLPTRETLDRIMKLAETSGYAVLDTGQTWKCKLHPPALPSDDICWKCELCGDFMSQPQIESPSNTNTALSEALSAEHLGLSPQLCDDLVVVLSSPRYQLFNWLLPWKDLHRLCVLYLSDPERTKNFVTELKFLDIDYSVYMSMKREPEDEEITGIERGYEHFLEEDLYPEERVTSSSEDSISQDSRSYGLGSDGMEDNSTFLPPPAKSDPKVLKSLRLFRPNLKRPKTSQLPNETPSKVFIKSETVSNLNQGRALTSISNTPQIPTTMNYGPIFNNGNFAQTSQSSSFNCKTNFTLPKPTIPPPPYESFTNFSNLTITPLPYTKPSVSKHVKSSTSGSKLTITPVPKETISRTNASPSISSYETILNSSKINYSPSSSKTANVQKLIPSTSRLNSAPPASYDKLFNFTKESINQKSSALFNNSKKIANNPSYHQFIPKAKPSASLYTPLLNSTSSVINYATKDTALDMCMDKRPPSEPTPVKSAANNSKFSSTFSYQPKPNILKSSVTSLHNSRTVTSCDSLVSNSTATTSKNFSSLLPTTVPSLIARLSSHSSEQVSSNKTLTITPLPKVADNLKKPITSLSPGTVLSISPRTLSGSAKLTVVDVLTKTEDAIKNPSPVLDFNKTSETHTPPVCSKLEPHPVTSKIEPDPVSSKLEPDPVSCKTELASVSSKTKLAPVSCKPKSDPVSSKPKPDSVSNKAEPDSVKDLNERLLNPDPDKAIAHTILQTKSLDTKDLCDGSKALEKNLESDNYAKTCDDLKLENLKSEMPTCSKLLNGVSTEKKSLDVLDCAKKERGESLPQEDNFKHALFEDLADDVDGGDPLKKFDFLMEDLNSYVDRPKNVITFASSGNNSGESHCLQDIKSSNSASISAIEDSIGIDQPEDNKPADSIPIDEIRPRNKKSQVVKSIDSISSNETQTIDNVDNFLGGPSNRSNFRKFYHKTYSKLTRNKMRELLEKHDIKNAKVVLQRLILPENSKRKFKLSTISKWNRFLSPMRTSKRKIAKSENKTRITPKDRNRNNFSKTWPLQDINPKVNRRKHGKSLCENLKTDEKLMNSCVLLKRLEFDKDKKKTSNSVLANVPGLNDLQMIRPSSVDRIVQVVQVPGSRCTTSGPVQSTQTSTQVTPHIQRIGQPRIEKPERSVPDSTSTTNTTSNSVSNANSTTASESPTLINILSQQIIRPSNQNNANVKPRSSPLINILSQQIIKPATSTSTAKTSSSGNTEVQVNSIPRVISGSEQILNQLINPVRAPMPTLKTIVSSPTSDQNRIVQFICKASDGKLIPVTSFTSNKVVKVSMAQTVNSSTTVNSENGPKNVQTTSNVKTENSEISDILPKFQQAFGKPTYQNNVDSSECVVVNNDNASSDSAKSSSIIKTQPPKNSTTSLNVQPVQGGVIYTRQMPVAQTINLLPPGRGQVFRIATSNSEQLSLVKDSVIQGRMSALLAAALQGKQRTTDNESENNGEENAPTGTKVALTTRPMLVQSARIVKPVLQIPTNVIRSAPQSNLSSTTLEQLREFDMVYKQVKERSSGSAPTESSPQSDSNESPQQISVTYLNQNQKISCAPVVVVTSYCNVQSAASPSLSVTSQGSSSPCVTPAPTLALAKVATKSPKPKSIKNTTTHASKASPIPKPQQKPQEDEHTTQRIFDILAEYAEQLRNSPDLNNKPAPRRRSNPPTNPNQNAKRKKSSSSKKSGHCSSSLTSDGDMDDSHTVGSEDSSCGVVQISMQEEEQPPSVNSTEINEASTSPKQLIVNDTTTSQPRSLVITDTNVGGTLKMSNAAVLVPGNYIMPVSMVKGGQQIAVVSGGSKILATVPARAGPNMLLFQSFLNQTKKTNLPTLKYSTVQPISSITRSVANVTTSQIPTTTTAVTNQNLTTVTLSPTIAIQKVNQLESTAGNQNFDTELLLTIARPSENKITIEECQTKTVSSTDENAQNVRINNSTEKTFFNEEKSLLNSSVATSVIAQSISIKDGLSDEHAAKTQIMALNLNSSENDKDTAIKVQGRVQSVLVTTGTSNGPMLSHSPPTFNKQSDSTNSISESNKDEYLHNDGKRNSGESKSLQNSVYSYQGKIKKAQAGSQRLDRDLQRKQAAIERELHLQKSLSEECEDLGVDEPSTSDLFPEADLLFDSNHSPAFDQCSQDVVKRSVVHQEMKDENKAIGLFCDDEPMRSDFLFEPMEYQSPSIELDYDNRSRDAKRQICVSNEAGFLCEDNTLLQTCTSMSDVTIPSPISPDPYTDNSPPHLNKCKFKYSNRKRVDKSKQVENWPIELSSSEDTTGSTELKSCSRSSEDYSNKLNQNLSCDDEIYGYAIVERLKDDEECEEVHCKEIVNCPSGRGARRSVKKLCPCCNGAAKVVRKRLTSRPTTPFTQKKTVFAKRR